jgi:hypothetical protein
MERIEKDKVIELGSRRRIGALHILFEDLADSQRAALRKSLQLFLDPKSDKKTYNEKIKELEVIIKESTR